MIQTSQKNNGYSYKAVYLYITASLFLLAIFIPLITIYRVQDAYSDIHLFFKVIIFLSFLFCFCASIIERNKLKNRNEIYKSILDESILSRKTQGFALQCGLILTVVFTLGIPGAKLTPDFFYPIYFRLGVPVTLLIISTVYFTAYQNSK